MSAIMTEWRARKAKEDDQLHDHIRAAAHSGRVQLLADVHALDFQGSPVHAPWDHVAPLLGLMTLALIILLAAGVAIGIVAMTMGVLAHLLGNRHFVAWRLKTRATGYALESAAHFQVLWQLGGLALIPIGSLDAACVAPVGDWRKFAKRVLVIQPEAGPNQPEADAAETAETP